MDLKPPNTSQEMMSLQGREGAMRKSANGTADRVLAWEMRRLESTNQIAEERLRGFQGKRKGQELRISRSRLNNKTLVARLFRRRKERNDSVHRIGVCRSARRRTSSPERSRNWSWEKERWQDRSAVCVRNQVRARKRN